MRLLIAGTHAQLSRYGVSTRQRLVDVAHAKATVMPPRQAEVGGKVRVCGTLGSAGTRLKLHAENVIHRRRKKVEGHIVAKGTVSTILKSSFSVYHEIAASRSAVNTGAIVW